MEKRMDETMDAEKFLKELIHRALLGDHEAQQECTEKGIVLPCWRCGGESETQELHTGGKPIYAVTCKKTYCGKSFDDNHEGFKERFKACFNCWNMPM